MPQFSALEALAMARSLRPEVPIIIISDEIDLSLIVSLIKEGASDYISKTELVRLVPEIERVLQDKPHLYDERRRIAKA